MKAGLNQSTQLKQELKVNPRLYQAMDLLYMPLLDLQQHLKQELLNNPFLDMQEAMPMSAMEMPTPVMMPAPQPAKASVHSGSTASFGSERAIASLIAALDLSKEEVQARLRVVSMQGSTFSAYSENEEADIATMREFPLPPGTLSHSP